MNGPEKSDPAIVAVKPTNKAERSAAELVEPRAGAKGNADWQSTHRTQRQTRVSQAPERIRQLLAVWTRGGSRMRESRTYGSVRGARGNSRPYRVLPCLLRMAHSRFWHDPEPSGSTDEFRSLRPLVPASDRIVPPANGRGA